MDFVQDHDKTLTTNLFIVQINVNSLVRQNRRYDLQTFLKRYNPDIVLLNETKLNYKHKLGFENYNFLRKDRNAATMGGGTGILIKKGLKFKEVSNFTPSGFRYLETCVVKIPMTSNKQMYVISAYYPAGNNNDTLRYELQHLFESLKLDDVNNFYIMAGDLNCKHSKWGNPVNNSKGVSLNEWLSEKEIYYRCKLYASILPSYPRSGSYLDICIADSRIFVHGGNNSINCLETIDYDSDHNALKIVIAKNTNLDPFVFLKADENTPFDYKKTNWKKFQKLIMDSLNNDLIPNNRNLSNYEVEFHLERLNKIIISAIEKSVPTFTHKNQLQYIINPIIKKLQSEKSRLVTAIKKHNRLQNILSPSLYNFLKNKLKLIRKLLQDNFIRSMNKCLERKLSSISSSDPSKMFFEVKKQCRSQKPLELNILKIPRDEVSLLCKAGINPLSVEIENSSNKYVLRNDESILNVVGAYLESIYSSKNIDNSNRIHTEVTDSFNSFLEEKVRHDSSQTRITDFNENRKSNDLDDSMTENYFITRDNIMYIFSKLRGKKSSGIDKIPNIILKKIPSALIFEYLILFNNMINNAFYPKSWKMAKVVILPKKDKDPTDPKNLRAISLLPNISKIFEMCTNNIIVKHCQVKNLICEKQFGFKHRHSTIHAIHILVSHIHWNWNKKLCTGACLIDFEKAFDSIWIQGLIYKLIKYGFPFHLVILLFNMIDGKEFVICNRNNMSSQLFKMSNGLQQGTVNAPILFNLFIHDLLNSLDYIIGFADDILIYQSGDKIDQINSKLQETFHIVEKYSIDWNMKINTEKCETILFRPPVDKCSWNIRKNWKQFGIISTINNNVIPNKDVVKYLGIYLDKFLYFHLHIEQQIKKARNAFFSYKSIFFSKFVDENVKILMYTSMVRSIICYGAPIWFNISPSYMEKIRKFERKCLRSCTSINRSPSSNFRKYVSNKLLYKAVNINRVDNFIIKIIRNHIIKCTECNINNLINAPYYVDESYISNTLETGYVPPEAFVYLDKMGYIQNSQGVPMFYHLYRRANVKAFNSNIISNNEVRFDISVTQKDLDDQSNIQKFWWINS